MASRIRAKGGRSLSLTAALLLCASAPVLAQQVLAQQDSILQQESYLTPAPEIARIITAPRHENISLTNLSPDQRYFLHSLSGGLPSLADYAKPHHLLGGIFIDPAANRARSFTTGTGTGFELISAAGGSKIRIAAPSGALVSSASWSPDGKRVGFFAHFPDATYLYVADVANGKTRRLTGTPVLATLVTSFDWTEDGNSIITVLVPEKRGPAPQEPVVPQQPQIRLTQDGENKLRTYASLLADPHEKALLEYYTTGQLASVDVNRGRVRKIGSPAMIRSIDPAPSGDYFRVTTMQKPFSYIAPVSSFATVEEIWDLDGKALAELQSRPLNEGIREPRDSTAADTERRNLTWRPDGAGLTFLQMEPAPKRSGAQDAAADAEDVPAAERTAARRKDRVMQWLPPFDSASTRVVYTSTERIASLQHSTDPRLLFLTESARGSSHVYAVSLDEPDKKYTIYRHRTEDFYTNPGSLMTTSGAGGGGGGGFGGFRGASGTVRLSADGSAVFLSGTTYSKTPLEVAPRPFVDKVEIRTGTKERVFESAPNLYERVTAVLDDDLQRVVISRESPTMVQDFYVLDRRGGAARKLTENVDHAPEMTAAQRSIVEVTRGDGLSFWVRVTLPESYRPGTRLPAMFWFYPREYTDQESYDRTNRTYNKNEFRRLGTRTIEILTQAGYAVIEPDAPIIGPSGRMNDFYVHDLRNNLSAVIDEMDRRGFIDRTRLGLGGHSYGAFSTVNAMVHTPFFRAGIAGDGNYNRSLTPLGFQSERREFWEARETYLEMSAFFWANRLNGALLMYHGMADQNLSLIHI